MIDYYSISFETNEAALAVIERLDVLAVDGPFQITGDQGWYFNVRSDHILTGEWIAPTPETPSRIWA